MSEVLATVPVVCIALGAVAGFPAARLVASHLSIMTRRTSQVLIGGPALVERATREKLTKEELGGPDVHMRSGVVDNLAEDEADALRQARRFLGYLPSNVSEPGPVAECSDPRERCDERLIERSRSLGAHMLSRLRALDSPALREVRGRGLWAGVEIDPSVASARAVCERLLEKGVLSKDTHGTVVRLAPPLVIAPADLDWALDRLEEALHELDGSRRQPAAA